MDHRPSLIVGLFAASALFAAGCAASTETSTQPAQTETSTATVDYGAAPAVPDGPLDPAIVADLDLIFGSLQDNIDLAAIGRVGRAGDARVAWLLVDLLRFTAPDGDVANAAVRAWESATGRTADTDSRSVWNSTTNHLIAWDTPAPPGYTRWKRQLFELVEPAWAPFFDDADAAIDWRWISWGGVLIDDRPVDQVTRPCTRGCIPALDDPGLTDANGGDWYPDEKIVFGVVVGDSAVAFPKNIMEVHEMINMTIEGRRIALPYCTLCGSAQAYFTDAVEPGVDLNGNRTYELRTSGLLSRSNKVMFELHTRSVFDTFTGEAVSGPLREAGVHLQQLTVQVSTWGEWKRAHPDTRIVAADGGIGRSYAIDPLRGRDDEGPIFPIGDVDDRLPVQESVVGVQFGDTTVIAFPAAAARATLESGSAVELDGVTITIDGGGLVAHASATGEPIAVHQAFWFAWSQFHPDTDLWAPTGADS